MGLKIIILIEVIQAQEDKCHTFCYMWVSALDLWVPVFKGNWLLREERRSAVERREND